VRAAFSSHSDAARARPRERRFPAAHRSAVGRLVVAGLVGIVGRRVLRMWPLAMARSRSRLALPAPRATGEEIAYLCRAVGRNRFIAPFPNCRRLIAACRDRGRGVGMKGVPADFDGSPYAKASVDKAARVVYRGFKSPRQRTCKPCYKRQTVRCSR
jgi:hypothetical protein